MQLFKYKFVNQHGLESFRFVNLNTVTGIVMNENEKGELIAISLLSNAPTSQEYESVPVRAKVDKNGKVIVNKQGEQEIVFTNKPVQKHIIFTISYRDDMERFIETILDERKEQYNFSEQVHIEQEDQSEVSVTA